MALVRCDAHGKPEGTKVKDAYVKAVEPVGYPETAAICGRSHCEQPGHVWLIAQEYEEYQCGQRTFGVKTQAVKVRVT